MSLLISICKEMKIITIYAVVNNEELVTTTHKEKQALETAELLNKSNKTSGYIVIPCNGLVIK